MNPIQEAVNRVTGISQVLEEQSQRLEVIETENSEVTSQLETVQYENWQLSQALEQQDSMNALLQRQIEDIDYLNLFDFHSITEVIPLGDRKKYYKRLRRLRHENPLAKQAIKLITRFTLGNGVQVSIGPDPDVQAQRDAAANVLPDELLPGQVRTSVRLDALPGSTPLPPPASRPAAPPPKGRPQVTEDVQLDNQDQLKEIVTSFWKDADNQRAFTSHEAMKEWLDGVATDGEKMFIGFTADVEPYIKLTEIPIEEIGNIIYDPDNWKKPVYYKRQYTQQIFDGQAGMYKPDGQPITKYYLDYQITDEDLSEIGNRIKIPADQEAPHEQRIFHTMVNPLWTKEGKRGISELFASREWFRVFKEFMENRAAINEAATAIAYKRKIKAGPTGVAQFQGKLGGLDVGYDSANNVSQLSKLTRPSPAAVYDSNPAVDLDWMKTDTGAINAKEDGRGLLAAAGSGVGIFVHYFGEGGDANLATAQAMELPMVKTFEDWQEWVNSTIRTMLFWVITIATDVDNAKKQIDRISGNFPPLISQDVVKYTTAISQLTQNIAAGNKVVHREAIKYALNVLRIPNVDALMTQIEAEELALEAQRQAHQAAMLDALKNQPVVDPNASSNGNGNGKPPGAGNGSGNALPSDLATVVKGKVAPERNGPKPA